jgi:[protein-PII] uridylyltransferase
VFSNICGALSSFGMDISRGHAMTNPNGLVLGHLSVHGSGALPRAERRRQGTILEVLGDVISGGTDITERLRSREQSVLYRRRSGVTAVAPVVHADNQSSRRYTILDIVADNALGLLHRVSRSSRATDATWPSC